MLLSDSIESLYRTHNTTERPWTVLLASFTSWNTIYRWTFCSDKQTLFNSVMKITHKKQKFWHTLPRMCGTGGGGNAAKYMPVAVYKHCNIIIIYWTKYASSKKGKVLPYSLPSVGPGADPKFVQAVSPQVTISHPPGGKLPILSARPELYLRKHLADGATPNGGNRYPIAAYYSSVDPEEMKGWVGLVGWPTADGLPT